MELLVILYRGDNTIMHCSELCEKGALHPNMSIPYYMLGKYCMRKSAFEFIVFRNSRQKVPR